MLFNSLEMVVNDHHSTIATTMSEENGLVVVLATKVLR
jgi:hypothetical protein